jgi:hypothetical protein
MSATADVMEMKSLFEQLAEALAPSGHDKEQVEAIRSEFRTEQGEYLFTWNRVLELLKGKARRVDGYEKDAARERIERLRRQRAINQISNLNRTLAYLKRTDPDGYRTHIDSLERSLALAGVLGRSLAQPGRREDVTDAIGHEGEA